MRAYLSRQHQKLNKILNKGMMNFKTFPKGIGLAVVISLFGLTMLGLVLTFEKSAVSTIVQDFHLIRGKFTEARFGQDAVKSEPRDGNQEAKILEINSPEMLNLVSSGPDKLTDSAYVFHNVCMTFNKHNEFGIFLK